MRYTLPHIPTAARRIVAAAILAGALASGAQAQAPGSGKGADEETAFAFPRVVLRTNTEVALPQPLGPSDAALVRRIFALQDHGKLADADRLIDNLQDKLLLGEILADRYLGPYHHSTAPELQDWLEHYAELPDAPAIRALLLRRAGPNADPPPAPPARDLSLPRKPAVDPTDSDPDPEPGITRSPVLDSAVALRLDHSGPHAALRLIAETRHLSPAYGVLLRAEVARALFAANDNVEALRVAVEAEHAVPAKDRVGRAYYVAGLAAWRLGRIESARTLFEAATHAPVSTPRIRAAAAFWASRTNLWLHAHKAALEWMRKAAMEHRTLYGLLARRVLGLHTGIIPSGSLLSQADVDAVAAVPAGDRAFALLEVGQTQRAAAELRVAWAQVKGDPGMRRSVLLVAAAAGLRDLAGRFAMLEAEADGTQPAEPSQLPRLRPAHGFRIDPALVYAVTRMESNFNANAVSAAGARGLMQIMPVTARYVAGNPSLSTEELHNPGLNLALGQRYLASLAQQSVVDDNLLYLLASYNAGAGNLASWLRSMHDHDDPLLFLEAIPVPQTRAFVTEVLTYTWLYAARLHVPAPSLDALAAGEFPRFTPLARQGKVEPAALQAD